VTHVRDLTAADEGAWRRLWDGYCAFYQTEVPDEVTDATWAATLAADQPLIGRAACADGGAVIGFSLSVLHASTWQLKPSAYLEDLFVDQSHRGSGAGRALLDDLVALAKARDWGRLYWHTKADNVTARRLYDRYGAADDFVRYRLTF